jgi:type I restriction enzyme S subunit
MGRPIAECGATGTGIGEIGGVGRVIEWREILLGDVAEEMTVGFVGSMAVHYVDNGIPFLRSQDIHPYKINFSDIKYISPDFHSRIQKSSLKSGDVVIVRTGKPGTSAVVPDGIGQLNCSDLVIVRPGQNLDSHFLCYYINTVASSHVAAHLVGAVQQHFNVGSAKQLKMHLPPLPIQRQIAAILSAFDDKIELNRQMNRTLEQMARTLFQSWFVDFDPVRAKMRGKTPEGMDAATAALFPDELIQVDGKEVPKGWSVSTVGDVFTLYGGSTPSTSNPEFWEQGEYHWTTPKDMSGLEVPFLTKTERKITRLGVEKITSGVLPIGTVLLSSRAPVGYLAIAAMPVSINQGYIALDSTGVFGKYFILNFLQSQLEEIKGIASGTTFIELSKKVFRYFKLVVPNQNIADAYEAQVDDLYSQIKTNIYESAHLTQLRDSLLPRLLSGEVDMGEWKELA